MQFLCSCFFLQISKKGQPCDAKIFVQQDFPVEEFSNLCKKAQQPNWFPGTSVISSNEDSGNWRLSLQEKLHHEVTEQLRVDDKFVSDGPHINLPK